MNRGRRGKKIFATTEDYGSFVDLLEELDEVFNVKVAAYCLMSTQPKRIRLYKKFVLKETPEEINQIFGRRNLPAVLGSKSFVDRIKDKFFNLKNAEQMSETKRLAPDIDKIKHAVCMFYDIKETELYVTRRGYLNEPRNVAVYLIRRLRNDTLKHVGQEFGIEKYSTVSSIVERVKYEVKADKGLKNRIQNLAEKISKSQRQT